MAVDAKAARRILLARRAELEADSEASAEARRPVTLDQQSVGRLSRMDAMQVQAMAEATERQRGLEIRRIDAALVRIEAGDYGFCARCDEPIESRRLEVDPATPFCIGCADKPD